MGYPVLFRQIARLWPIARRIVWYVKEGDKVEQGQQFGFIKFGSRVDVFLPLGSTVKVEVGEAVKGGHTILAELPKYVAPVKPEKIEEATVVAAIETVKPVKKTTRKKA